VKSSSWPSRPVKANAMSDTQRVVLRPNPSTLPEQARDARARAWAYPPGMPATRATAMITTKPSSNAMARGRVTSQTLYATTTLALRPPGRLWWSGGALSSPAAA
jgi:hypothetical protein